MNSERPRIVELRDFERAYFYRKSDRRRARLIEKYGPYKTRPLQQSGGQSADDAIDELPGKLNQRPIPAAGAAVRRKNQRDIRVLGKRGTSFAGRHGPSGMPATSRSSMG